MSDTKEISQVTSLPEKISGGPEWLVSLRKESQKRYNSADLPLRTSHLWKYTDPKQFVFDKASETKATPSDSPGYDQAKEQIASGELSALVFDGAGQSIEVIRGKAPGAEKLVVKSLREASAEDLPQKYLGQVINANLGKFEALNSALWSDGVFVYVPKGVKIAEPIHLLRRGAPDEGWWYGRTLIIVDEGAEVTVSDEYFSSDDETAGRSNHVVEIFGLANSNTEYFALQRNNLNSISYFTERTHLAESAKTTLVAATLGGKVHKADLGTILEGRNSQSLQYGLVFGSGKQKLDHHTVHMHRGSNGYSNLDFKVVMKDRARSAYTGLIRVDENVQNCEAYQSNRNLLLNRGASAESIPELEIMCDEVICTHGATVGPIDEMQVFYLMNRGIPRNEAVKMIVRGHVEPTLKLLPKALQPRVIRNIEERLETL